MENGMPFVTSTALSLLYCSFSLVLSSSLLICLSLLLIAPYRSKLLSLSCIAPCLLFSISLFHSVSLFCSFVRSGARATRAHTIYYICLPLSLSVCGVGGISVSFLPPSISLCVWCWRHICLLSINSIYAPLYMSVSVWCILGPKKIIIRIWRISNTPRIVGVALELAWWRWIFVGG